MRYHDEEHTPDASEVVGEHLFVDFDIDLAFLFFFRFGVVSSKVLVERMTVSWIFRWNLQLPFDRVDGFRLLAEELS